MEKVKIQDGFFMEKHYNIDCCYLFTPDGQLMMAIPLYPKTIKNPLPSQAKTNRELFDEFQEKAP